MSALRDNSFRATFAAVGLAFAIGAGPASAALVVNPLTAPGSIPGTPGTNDLLNDPALSPLGIGTTLGFFGANISQTGSAQLKFDFLGYEAGFANTFTSFNLGGQIFSTESFVGDDNHATSLNSPLASFIINGVNGLLNFVFNTPAGSVANGANTGSGVNFFTSVLGDGSVVLWLDDSGAGPDTDYDDMVIRISEVPLPPALLLFGSALLGMNWLRRRRQNLFG